MADSAALDEPLVPEYADDKAWAQITPEDKNVVCGLPVEEGVWLLIFCITGVGLGMSFEFMDLHSSKHAPASGESFFLCLVGYWSQTILGGLYALTRPDAMRGPLISPIAWPCLASRLPSRQAPGPNRSSKCS